MAIEVRELIIRATILQDGAGEDPGAAGTNDSSNNAVSPGEELITICVEKILEILKEKHER